MAAVIAILALFGLSLSLAHQKSGSAFRPRGRFEPSVVWGQLPALPRPELRARPRTTRPAPARA